MPTRSIVTLNDHAEASKYVNSPCTALVPGDSAYAAIIPITTTEGPKHVYSNVPDALIQLPPSFISQAPNSAP
jgi:hypothetical protein